MKRLDRSARARPAQARPTPTRGARAPGAASAAAVAQERDLDVVEMGARGDASAIGEDGPIYLPFALPGERVRANVAGDRGVLSEVLTPSAERITPVCPHYGTCGGCQLQHWAEDPYLGWKREQVAKALGRRGIGVPVAPTIPAWGEGRRRAAFHAARSPRGLRFGYAVRGGGALIDAKACPALAPGFEAALPQLRRLVDVVTPPKGEVTIPTLWTPDGLDVDVRGVGGAGGIDRGRFEQLAELAQALDLARLSFEGEPLVARRASTLKMGAAFVQPPPGAFLQPTALGEETLARLVISALGGATRVADLFCGVGTFALRIASFAETHAVEGEQAMLQALKRASDGAAGALKAISVERRDLLRSPLAALELKRFDAVVFDPPRSGSRLQADQIARSKAARVAAVSCDPATFARDARVLIDGGFTLTTVTPVDQFRWSPHVEIVGAFQR